VRSKVCGFLIWIFDMTLRALLPCSFLTNQWQVSKARRSNPDIPTIETTKRGTCGTMTDYGTWKMWTHRVELKYNDIRVERQAFEELLSPNADTHGPGQSSFNTVLWSYQCLFCAFF
jgi:hypothetical protein